jgi:hypothetical protein
MVKFCILPSLKKKVLANLFTRMDILRFNVDICSRFCILYGLKFPFIHFRIIVHFEKYLKVGNQRLPRIYFS